MNLLHFTDSHLALTPAPPTQFHVQPFWQSATMRVLFQRLGSLAKQADAIVFTGDATHGGGKAEAAQFFQLLAAAADGKPVFMVMGNHDVVNPGWKENFLAQAQPYGNIKLADGVYPLGDIDLLVMQAGYVTANNSIEVDWHPEVFPVPALSDESAKQLSAALSVDSARPVLGITHCPSHLLPPVATGFPPYVAAGMEAYARRVNALLDEHPRVRCLLSGHVHLNSVKISENGRVHQSLASFAEYPCQVRMVELTPTRFRSRLLALADESEAEMEMQNAGGNAE